MRGDNSDSIHATPREENSPLDIRSGIVDTEKSFSPRIPLKPLLPLMGIACSVDDHVSVPAPDPLCVNALGVPRIDVRLGYSSTSVALRSRKQWNREGMRI